MSKEPIGLLGLAVMGQRLGWNMAGYNLEDIAEGYPVVGWNRTASKVDEYLASSAGERIAPNITGAHSIEELVSKVGKRGIYWLMVKVDDQPTDAVDGLIDDLLEHLEPGAIIIDGGNTHYTKTVRRQEMLAAKGIGYCGTGVSGGEEGALLGPAYMPGCTEAVWARIEPIFKMTAAKAEQDGKACVDRCGLGGAGHYVKMIHNAIEYGDMAMIGESVWLLNGATSWDMGRIGTTLGNWNAKDDPLSSYLIEITADGIQQPDSESEAYLVERTADITRMKGTGLWACRVANQSDFLVSVPTWYAALQARLMSMNKELRMTMSENIDKPVLSTDTGLSEDEIAAKIHNGLYAGKLASYAQGMAMLAKASEVYGWGLDMHGIPLNWRGGCIIRAGFLDHIARVYADRDAQPEHLLAPAFFQEAVAGTLGDLQYVSALASNLGIPTPALDASKNYILQLASSVLLSSAVQAQQRDYFGAHGYFKTDEAGKLLYGGDGSLREVHMNWMAPRAERVESPK